MKKYHLNIITPRGIFYEGEAAITTLKISEGYVGIMADRMPLISSVKISKFTLKKDETKEKIGVIGNGIIKTKKDKVDILVNDVLWIDETSLNEAKKKLEISKEHFNSIKEEGIKKDKAQEFIDFWELTISLIK